MKINKLQTIKSKSPLIKRLKFALHCGFFEKDFLVKEKKKKKTNNNFFLLKCHWKSKNVGLC